MAWEGLTVHEVLTKPPVLPPREEERAPCASGRRAPPRWLAGVLFLGLAGGLWLVKWAVESHWPLPECTFLRLTGHPCPFCGTTRSLAALGKGEFWAAIRWNPLVVAAVVAVAGSALIRLVGVRPAWRIKARVTWAVPVLLVVLNWVWVLVSSAGR